MGVLDTWYSDVTFGVDVDLDLDLDLYAIVDLSIWTAVFYIFFVEFVAR